MNGVIYMNDKIFLLVTLALSIFAVAQLVRLISLKLFYPATNDRILTVIPIDEKIHDAEFLLRSAVIRMRWLGIKNSMIIALDNGADEANSQVCRIMEKTYPEISVISQDEFFELIS